VAAFRATLEETVRAELLLHVVDAASPAREAQAAEVDKVLAEIHADEAPRLVVWNKIDAAGLAEGVEREQYGRISRVLLSARTGAGLDELRGAIAEFARERAAGRAPTPQAYPLQPH
jgi:GTP-binding protein HflX